MIWVLGFSSRGRSFSFILGSVKILRCENFVYFINLYKNKGVYLNWASIKKWLSEGFKNSLEHGEKGA